MAATVQTRPTTSKELHKLAGEGTLHAVLDACDEPEVQARVHELGAERAPCLYRGATDPRLLASAPYLVRLDGALLGWLQERLWERPWGILVVTRLDLRNLRHHLRRHLTVRGPDHEALYFRFYDPRVLRTFLPTLGRDEVAEFFGPVLAYGVSDPATGGALLAFP